MQVIQEKHSKNKGLREEMITEVDTCKWSVQPDDNQSVYLMLMEVCRGPSCDLKCLQQCPNILIQNTTCKHVHLIATVTSTESTPAKLSSEIEPLDTLDDCMFLQNIESRLTALVTTLAILQIERGFLRNCLSEMRVPKPAYPHNG